MGLPTTRVAGCVLYTRDRSGEASLTGHPEGKPVPSDFVGPLLSGDLKELSLNIMNASGEN